VNQIEKFRQECLERIKGNQKNASFVTAARAFMQESVLLKYSYNMIWLAAP